jgi:hypothetical protein
LEDLPNELLTNIFKQLNARDLFRAFHNLNQRLNQLIHSFEYLQLRLHMTPTNVVKSNEGSFSNYVYTLIVDRWIDFNLKHFANVRRLKLIDPFPKVIEQLKANVMPNLEYLSVCDSFSMYENQLLRDEIFSNRFPKLLSCELYSQEPLMKLVQWTQSPVIRFLRTDPLDLPVYETILKACPNLSFLRFSLHPFIGTSTTPLVHDNLTHMIISLEQPDWPDADAVLSVFLSRVPKLRQLEIHRRNYSRDILEHWQFYDWLSSTISLRLPVLRVFKFHFYSPSDDELKKIVNVHVLDRIRDAFSSAHKGPYKAQLIIDGESI